MNRKIKKQIREMVYLVMEINEVGGNLAIDIHKSNLCIMDIDNGCKGYLKTNSSGFIYYNDEFWNKYTQDHIDAALIQLKEDLVFRKSCLELLK